MQTFLLAILSFYDPYKALLALVEFDYLTWKVGYLPHPNTKPYSLKPTLTLSLT